MKKRGVIIGIIGLVLILISLLVATSIIPQLDEFSDEFVLPDILEGMFNHVTTETVIFPTESNLFSYSSIDSNISLLWGLQILDYQDGDKFSVNIYDTYGDEFGVVNQDGPILFDTFVMPTTDVYTFEVSNTGTRPIEVVMMFAEDPDNSDAFHNTNSQLMSAIVPLAISGIILMVGISLLVVSGIICIIDWKKNKSVKYD